MNARELAQALNGIEYPPEISRELRQQAREAGLVIVHGASDDLIEFDGVISDERGCSGGKTFLIDGKGIQPSFERAHDDGEEALRDYFSREGKGKALRALWCAEPGYSWTYETDIPHETFEVVEDGEPYCRGIVFHLADTAQGGGARMNFERALDIVSAINSFVFETEGLPDRPAQIEKLRDVSLTEMIEADAIIQMKNAEAEAQDGSRVIYFHPDPRLIAAVYCFLHFSPRDGDTDNLILRIEDGHGNVDFLAKGTREISRSEDEAA